MLPANETIGLGSAHETVGAECGLPARARGLPAADTIVRAHVARWVAPGAASDPGAKTRKGGLNDRHAKGTTEAIEKCPTWSREML